MDERGIWIYFLCLYLSRNWIVEKFYKNIKRIVGKKLMFYIWGNVLVKCNIKDDASLISCTCQTKRYTNTRFSWKAETWSKIWLVWGGKYYLDENTSKLVPNGVCVGECHGVNRVSCHVKYIQLLSNMLENINNTSYTSEKDANLLYLTIFCKATEVNDGGMFQIAFLILKHT